MAKEIPRHRSAKSGSKHRSQGGSRQQALSPPPPQTASTHTMSSSSLSLPSTTHSSAQESTKPPHRPFSKALHKRIVVSSDSEEDRAMKPSVRINQSRPYKIFRSSSSSVTQTRHRKLQGSQLQQQIATGIIKRKAAGVPSGLSSRSSSHSGKGKGVHTPAHLAQEAAAAQRSTIAHSHAEEPPVPSPPPPQLQLPSATNPSKHIIIPSSSDEDGEMPQLVQPMPRWIINTTQSSATAQPWKQKVSPPQPQQHPAIGITKLKDDSVSSDSSSGSEKRVHTPASSAQEMPPAQLITVTNTQEQEPSGTSHYPQQQSCTTITGQVIISESEENDHPSVQPTLTVAVNRSIVILVPDSEEEGHTSMRSSLPRGGIDFVQLSCIKSSLVYEHPPRKRIPRPRPLRHRKRTTQVRVAPVSETSQTDMRDEIPASTDEESDNAHDYLRHILPTTSLLKMIKKGRVPTMEESAQAVPHFDRSSGYPFVACTSYTPNISNTPNTSDAHNTSNSSNTFNKPLSQPVAPMNLDRSNLPSICNDDGQPNVKDLPTCHTQELKSEPDTEEDPLVVPLAVAMSRSTSNVLTPKMETPIEALVAMTSAVEIRNADTPVVGTPAKAEVKIDALAVDTLREADATESSTTEFAAKTTAMDTPIIEAPVVAPVPADRAVQKAYPLRERTFQQRKPYTADKRLHARLNLGREESVQPSGQSPRKKNHNFADLQDDENDGDYEEGQENPVDTYYGREDSVADESFPSTRPSVRSTLDVDQVGAISKNLSSIDLADEVGPSVRRRRLYQRRDNSAVAAMSHAVEPESGQEEGDDLGEDEGEEEEEEGGSGAEKKKKKDGVSKYRCLPRSYFGKHKLPDDISTLKEMRKEEASSSSTGKAARSDHEAFQLAHHAKRRIVTEGQDEGALDDFIAQLALDDGHSETDSNRSDDDSVSSSSSSSRSPSPQPGSSGRFSNRGTGFGYGISDDDDEAFEAEIRAYSGLKAPRKSSSVKKTKRNPTTASLPENRCPESNVNLYRTATKHRRAGRGGRSVSKSKRSSKFRSPYTYADPHELNKDRMASFLSNSSTSAPARSKRQAPDDIATRLSRVVDPDAAQEFMFNSRLKYMHSPTNRRAHILTNLYSTLQYSQSVKRARLMDTPPSAHSSEESGAESDTTLHDYQLAECNGAQQKAFSEDLIYGNNSSHCSNYSCNNNNDNSFRISGAGTSQQGRGGAIDRRSKEFFGTHSANATTITRQVTSSGSASSSRHGRPVSNIWANGTLPVHETIMPGYTKWAAEQKRIRQEKENAVPLPPQYITRPTFTLPPPPTPPAPSRPSHEPAASSSTRETLADGSDNQIEDSMTGMGLVKLPPVREDVRAYLAESRSRNKELDDYRRKILPKWDHGTYSSPIAGNPVRGGLRFSEATYIGGGSLSFVLKAAELWRQGSYLPRETMSAVNVVGQSFPSDWPESPVMEAEMSAVVMELTDLLLRVLNLSRRLGSEPAEESQALQAEIFRALEGLTTVLINGLNYPMVMGRRHVWMLFEANIVAPLNDLAESEKIRAGHRYSSPAAASFLWLRWAVFSWHFLNESAMQWDNCEAGCKMDEACGSLLGLLFKADDVLISGAIERMRDGMQESGGTIYGQDVIEIWICLIHTLNQSAQYHRRRGFWTCFNSQVSRLWAEAESTMVGDVDELTGESRAERGRRYFDLVLELCALHQFERRGSSVLNIVAPENWVLVCWLLTHGLLDRNLAETVQGEQQCRYVTILCHRLVQVWKWGPGADATIHIARFHENRQNRNMRSENGYRFPDFLKTMIETATVDLEQDYNIPKDDDVEPTFASAGIDDLWPISPRFPRLTVDMSLVETVRSTDWTFEIFLKLVVLTLHQKVELISQEPQGDLVIVPQMDDPKLREVESMAVLTKYEKYRSCRRFISRVLPEPIVMMLLPNAAWDPLSSVCNACNIVLIVSLLTPDCLRPLRVRDMVALLQPKATNDHSRRIVAKSLYYLGTIWQRQAGLGKMAILTGRHVDHILEFYYNQLEEMLPTLESEVQPSEDPKREDYRTLRRLPPATGLAELILRLMARLLESEGRWEPGGTKYPKLAFLDKRLAPFIGPAADIDSTLRCAAYILIEEFFEHRKAHKERLERLSASESANRQASLLESSAGGGQLVPPATSAATLVAVSAATSLEDYDLSWMDASALDDDFVHDSLAGADSTQPEPTQPEPVQPKPVTVILEEDGELANILEEWVYPVLTSMVTERRWTLQEKYIKEHPGWEKVEVDLRPTQSFFCPVSMQRINKRTPPVQQSASKTTQSDQEDSSGIAPAAQQGTSRSIQPAKQGTSSTTQLSRQGTVRTIQTPQQGPSRTAHPPKQGTSKAIQPAKQGTSSATQSSRQGTNKAIQTPQQGTSRTTQPAKQGNSYALQPAQVDQEPEPEQPPIVVTLSRTALQYLRDVVVDVSAILLDQKVLTMDDIKMLFIVEPCAPPAFQHWVLEDKLAWATRMAEKSPGLLAEEETFFLSSWFTTIGAPVHELKLQVQFSEAIVKHSLSLPRSPVGTSSDTAKMTLSGCIFDNIPWLAITPQPQTIDASQDPDDFNQLLAQINEEVEQLENFKASRYNVLVKVLSNMGDHYAKLRSNVETAGPYGRMQHTTQEVRYSYRQCLLLLFRSLAAGYRRLEMEKLEDAKRLHGEFISDIFGHALVKCELIMRNDFAFQEYPVSFLVKLRSQFVPPAVQAEDK